MAGIIDKKSLGVVKITPANMRDAYQLYSSILNGKLSFNHFYAKYTNKCESLQCIGYLAYVDDKPAGLFGALTNQFEKEGMEFIASQSCDACVSPEFRGSGIITALASECISELKQIGAHFIFGMYSNIQIRSAMEKINWSIINNPVFRFNIIEQPKGIFRISNKLKWLVNKKEFYSQLNKHLQDYDGFFNILKSEYGIAAVYNSKNMTCRQSNDKYMIELNDVKIWIKIKSYIDIGAIVYNDELSLKIALDNLRSITRMTGKNLVINAPFNSRLYTALCKYYDPIPSWQIGYLNFKKDFDGAELLCNSADIDTF